MPIAGRLVARHGSRPVTRVAALGFALALALPALAGTFVSLLASLVALGLTNGMLDVAMNAQAATVQRRYRQPIMSRVHALYSFGGLAGAVLGGRIAAVGIEVRPHLTMVSFVLAAASLVLGAGMLPASADAAPEQSPTTRLTRHLAALGFVAFCVLFGEGAMVNWSVVYLRDVVAAGPGLAAAGFAAFSLAMASGRAVGDALTTHLRPVRLARLGGALACLGATVAIVVPRHGRSCSASERSERGCPPSSRSCSRQRRARLASCPGPPSPSCPCAGTRDSLPAHRSSARWPACSRCGAGWPLLL
jgi:MFS family permease